MTAITTLGVDNLSLRGAANEYNLITRLFTTKAEADAALAAGSGSGGWVPTAGKTNICFTADQGILKYDFSSTSLVNADSATRSYVDTQLANLVDSAPAALDTLNELAAAINDDANVFTTLNNSIAAVQTDVNTNEADADAAIAANEVHIDNAATLSGVAKDSTHLATFTGSTITDNQTIKAALQLLETKVEAVQTDVDGNESDADTAIAANETHIDNVATLSGVAKDSTHLSTFTGATIADNQTVKAALQALETKVEAVQTDVDGNESDADSAIAAVQADVNQNESDADAAIAAVQADVNQNESDADAAIAANEVHIDNAATLSGVAKDSTHLGTFTGSTISDNQTVKASIQAVETAVETKLNSSGAKAALDVDHLITLSGVSAAADHLGTFTGSTISDSRTGKQALQDLETSLEEVDANANDITTAVGVAEQATHMGTFTGSTISANGTAKEAIQELETAVETKLNSSGAKAALDVDHLITLSGVSAAADSLGSFSGSTITDNGTTKEAIQELETAIETKLNSTGSKEALDVDHLITLSGVAAASDALGTFSGSTINDNVTVKAALQALETKVEAVQTDVDGNESDADSAIAAVQSDVNQNESDADAAIAANEVHIDNAATLSGVAKDSTHLATFTGSTIADNQTIKAALQALETKAEAVQTDVDGNESDADAAIAANEVHIDNAATLSGVAKDATHLGTFTGSTITDNGTAKEAIQELETAVETKLNSSGAKAALDVDHLITLSGVSAAADHLGTFTGSTINDSVTLKAALQALETKVEAVQTDVDGNESDADTAIAANETHIDNAVTLTGVSKDATHLGTFTGSTVADNQTIKAAVQALETKVEAVQTDVDGNESDADTAIAANETHIDNAVTLTGVAKDATHLGAFSGSTISDNGTIKAGIQEIETALELKSAIAGPTFTGTPAAPTASAGTNTTQIATTAFVATAVANTIDGAPGALDTLNELAAALNDDASAATNLTTLINARSPSANGTHTGTTNIALLKMSGGLTDAANDSAAASAGIAVNQLYRNGSVVMIRVS